MISSSGDPLAVVIAQVLGVARQDVTDESSPQSLPSWDSLNHLKLVLPLEDEFEISLDPEDALEMHTVGLIRVILADYGVGV